MLVGLISDTHGVCDDQVIHAFRDAGVEHVVHAGDVGHHGGHAEVLEWLAPIAPVTAVRGNVDDGPDVDLPQHVVLRLAGWTMLVLHIAGMPPKVSKEAQALIALHDPEIVVTGHSHKYSVEKCPAGRLFINPGSAGPARFKLPRSAAILALTETQGEAKTDWKKFLAAWHRKGSLFIACWPHCVIHSQTQT
ncbi:hypothetical protein APUTEX25_003603 [Auxenochlorella protothecoides]|uniref:Vacuolar protein sorting-associated protein 29 n=1 Tax=Auxenochlorella protothecoides TaxID=3075 RepID=A0A3M7L6N1_AUXPR|nr:hypothetical protein APUTEX25_003603 [Auxenochlorella protothecoides]|eukprot:RMZ57146.1 hypothetical protein APUTEX25_003603 [Auxenochlorella protothecoides]